MSCLYSDRITPVSNQGGAEYGWNVFQPWEENAIGEVSAIRVGNMYYACFTAGWQFGHIGTATSTDGIHWTKSLVPAIGWGYGGEAGKAERGNLVYFNGEFRIYYSNTLLFYDYSSDFVTWYHKAEGVVLSGQIPNTGVMANSGVWIDPQTGIWYILLEFGMPSGPQWQTFLLTSNDDGATFQYALGPVTSLQVGGAVWGGASKINYSYGKWHVLYHTGPGVSQVWHAETTDITTNSWVPDAAPYIALNPSNYCGLASADQVADPDFLELANGQVVVFFNAVSNGQGLAQIGEYVFTGDTKSLFSCPFIPYSPAIRPVITFLKK